MFQAWKLWPWLMNVWQRNHKDTFTPYILLVNVSVSFEWYNRIYNKSIENVILSWKQQMAHIFNWTFKSHTTKTIHVFVLEVIWLCNCTGSHLTESCIVLLVTCYQIITTAWEVIFFCFGNGEDFTNESMNKVSLITWEGAKHNCYLYPEQMFLISEMTVDKENLWSGFLPCKNSLSRSLQFANCFLF